MVNTLDKMAVHGCMDFLFANWSNTLSRSAALPYGEEKGCDRNDREEDGTGEGRVAAAKVLQSWMRVVLEERHRTIAASRLQAVQRARVVRAGPLARSVRLFLRERRRALSLERSLGRLP